MTMLSSSALCEFARTDVCTVSKSAIDGGPM